MCSLDLLPRPGGLGGNTDFGSMSSFFQTEEFDGLAVTDLSVSERTQAQSDLALFGT